MPKGTIKRLVRDRGFGFIRDDGGQEWFFHRSGVQGSFDQLARAARIVRRGILSEGAARGASAPKPDGLARGLRRVDPDQ